MGSKRRKGETRGRKTGQPVGEYSLKYTPTCVMCGKMFPAARPDAKTGSNLCRSALRRWALKYGHDPETPPGITPAGKTLPGCSFSAHLTNSTRPGAKRRG